MTSSDILSWEEFQDQAHLRKAVPKYSTANEPKKHHPWWELDKSGIHSNLNDIAEKIDQATKTAAKLDSDLNHVAVTASKLGHIDRSNPVKVALIGAQAAGKSLLVNALFDCSGLSLTGAEGVACTCTVVKYAYAPGEGFAAEVCFLNAKKREAMISEHIRSLVQHYNDLDSDDEGESCNSGPKQDQSDDQRKKTADDLFGAIFGSNEEYKAAWNFSSDTAEFKTLCELKCQDATKGFDVNGSGAVIFTRPTPQELLKDVKPFLSKVDDQDCLWPLVDCVTIRFNHSLLHEGLEIIDLPGSGDINMLRARHIDEVKDTVDVEIILGDTARIVTDKRVINATRAGALNRGFSKVKVVLSDNQLSHSVGDIYARIDQLLKQADINAQQAEEDDDSTKIVLADRYKQYLIRRKKGLAIHQRAIKVTNDLGATLQGPLPQDQIEIFNTSASDYMNWIQSDKISYDSQPALSPEDTGVPALRRFLFNLPANQNLRACDQMINVTLPAFIDKLKRVVSPSDRDVGFQTIADECNSMHELCLRALSEQLKHTLLNASIVAMTKAKRDVPAYKLCIDERVRKQWVVLSASVFNRILKSKGNVPKGTSKAKGLERSIHWNADLAGFLKPLFTKWHAIHTHQLRCLRDALPLCMDRLYFATIALMSDTAANVVTVEKAKMKWKSAQHRLQTRAVSMINHIMAEEKRLMNRVTLEDERENNLIAEITDSIYDEVFTSLPELVSKPGQKKRYIMSMINFKRSLLKERLISSEPQAHFVDKLLALFQDRLDETMYRLVDKHFAIITANLRSTMKIIHDHGPVDFTIDSLGETVREVLSQHIPYIEAKAQALCDLLPAALKEGNNETFTDMDDSLEDSDVQAHDLKYFLEKVFKQKKRAAETTVGGVNKKMKT
ncbi:hypothetical protein IQ07DRAFT_681710 [Pyrenochaeta sp. DS3sAY3a]|nr:hypothetical protein IQ07DRAFT_681710 [Pyrenochaeta sp. DS3sAY3a]